MYQRDREALPRYHALECERNEGGLHISSPHFPQPLVIHVLLCSPELEHSWQAVLAVGVLTGWSVRCGYVCKRQRNEMTLIQEMLKETRSEVLFDGKLL